MNVIPVIRSEMVFHNFQSVIVRYIASGRLGNLVQDHVEVHDIAHQASNIFLTGERESYEAVTTLLGVRSLTSLETHRKPNPRTFHQIQSI